MSLSSTQQKIKKKFEVEDIGCCGGDYCNGYSSHNKKLKEFLLTAIEEAYEEGREEAIKKVTKFINNNQDCGACNLDLEIKEMLDTIKK